MVLFLKVVNIFGIIPKSIDIILYCSQGANFYLQNKFICNIIDKESQANKLAVHNKEDFMKKRIVILCAGVLSLAMVCGCGSAKSDENAATATPETTQEVTETSEDTETQETEESTGTDEETTDTTETTTEEESTSEEAESQEEAETVEAAAEEGFSSVMTEIYGLHADSENIEAAAENLKNYAFENGAPSSSSAFEVMANDWFDTMKDTEGKDIRAEFGEAFTTVTSAAQEMDENLEYDAAYLNVINGIQAAIGE